MQTVKGNNFLKFFFLKNGKQIKNKQEEFKKQMARGHLHPFQFLLVWWGIVGNLLDKLQTVREWNGHLEIFSLPQVIENCRQFLLLRTDILQKTVVGCPCLSSMIFFLGTTCLPLQEGRRFFAFKRIRMSTYYFN